MDCEELFKDLHQRIRQGTTHFRADALANQLRNAIEEYGITCDKSVARYLHIFLDHSFSDHSTAQTVEALKLLLSDTTISDYARLKSLILLAMLTLRTESFEQNSSYRKLALDIARKITQRIDEAIILNNWLFACIQRSNFDQAKLLLPDVESAFGNLSPDLESDSAVYEARSRFVTHKAKVLFLEARNASEPLIIEQLVAQAIREYEAAIERDKTNDHRRSNEQIELAEQIINTFTSTGVPSLDQAEAVLRKAEHSLDTHSCDACRGYFYYVSSLFWEARGNIQFSKNPTQAIDSWKEALQQCQESIIYYEKLDHPELQVTREVEIRIRKELDMANRPQRIFLSHSGMDKNLIREFKLALEILHLNPWLDEDAMTAGAQLERGLLHGFEESCAAVFFITSNFKDEGFLATEVNYAISEKRKKGDAFAIITLLLADEEGKHGEVPKLLNPYVWKKPNNYLDALRELIRALPLEIGYPRWKE